MDAADPAGAAEPTDQRRPTLEDILTRQLDDDALEDLICVYLQNRFGYLVRNATGRAPDYDYVLRNCDGEEALVHTRAGEEPVARDASALPAGAADRWFVFSPTNTYGPDPAPHVEEIAVEDVIAFIRSEPWSVPLTVSDRLEELDRDRWAA